MRSTFRNLGILGTIVLCSAALAGDVWTVDPSQPNDTQCINPTFLCKTLQGALDNAVSGISNVDRTVINVMTGTYETTGQTNLGGDTTAILVKNLDYLTVQSVAGNNPVVKPSTAANIVSISIENCVDLIVDNIDSDQTVAQFDNWHVFDSSEMIVRNCTFDGGEDGIDFNPSVADITIENNVFKNITTGNGDEALDFTDDAPTNIVIQDNLFDYNYRHITIGSGGDGFIIRRNTMDGTNSEEAIRLLGPNDVLIENNVILNNLQQGVYIDTGCSNITVQHNTFFNNDQENGPNGEIRTKVSTADIVIKNNIMYGNGSNPAIETGDPRPLAGEDFNIVYNVTDATFGPNTTTGDPKFVDTTAGAEDLHLKYGSPALEAGTNLGVTDDNEKSSRPNPVATNPDQGAYEHGPFAIPATGWLGLFVLLGILVLFLTRRTLRQALTS